MLINLINMGVVSKKKILMLNYKKIGLNENQVMILMMLMLLNDDHKTKFITPIQLSELMNFSVEKIESEINDLIERDLVKITSKNIDFSNVFKSLATASEREFLVLEDEKLVTTIEKVIGQDLSEDQINDLNKILKTKLSKTELYAILDTNKIFSYEDLKRTIANTIQKERKGISKFNWLEN
ncbi:DnaD family protein [Mesoplasma photuris]|uniref:DnaD family protein n=1 Tax=Mesoplasma photuris TaxID=217731 RepID=UPI0004E1D891|nr:DnaD family protein [Mesoplasma photuris]